VGYLRETKEGLACRVPLSEPSGLVVLFSAGEQAQYDLSSGCGEQLLDCHGKTPAGGYVVCADALLFVTDEAARLAFERRRIKAAPRPASEDKKAAKPVGETAKAQRDERVVMEVDTPWPDRRWPPPPCWDTAVYSLGAWQEA